MSILSKYEEAYNLGKPTFDKLFQLNKEELLAKLKEIFYDGKYDDILDNSPTVTKKIVNDITDEIIISCYDTLIITPLGINHKGEHYGGGRVITFDKFFKLD